MWEIYRRFRTVIGRPFGAQRTLSPQEIGKVGEKLAIDYLQKHHYAIVATNFTAPVGLSRKNRPITGEIDIVAYDQSSFPFVLAFIEVKTRTSDELALPEAAVNRRKRRQIIKVSRVYRRLMGVRDEPSRFDVVTILLDKSEAPQITCLQGYFTDRPANRGSSATDFLY